MRTRLVCCLLVLMSCAKRINPEPGESRTTYAGVPLRFGEQQQVPEGAEILWDFGDGTPQEKGASVVHAFPRGGVFTVVETIRHPDGQMRSARTHVVALRRPIPMAVPPDVRAALLVRTPWARMPVHREIAAKLSLDAVFNELARALSEAAGFDVLDAKTAEANGFDPEEGAAFFTVPQDPEALVFAIGTLDDARPLAAARRLLSSARTLGRYGSGPFQLEETRLPDGAALLIGRNAAGEKVGVLQRNGYLYLRLAGATDPAAALSGVAALPPDKGLSADPGFVMAVKHVGDGDAVFYSRGPDRASTGNGRFSNEVGFSAFTVLEKPEERELLQVRMFAQLKNLSGDQLVETFKPLKPPAELASLLPPNAAAYARISAAPQALWRELSRAAGGDATRLRERIQETTGLDLEKDLIPSFAGNIGIAVYLDASSLIEAILGEQVGSLDRSAFVIAAQLTSPQTVQAALERAMQQRPATDRAEVNGGSWFRLGDGAQAAIRKDVLFLALGGTPPGEEEPARGKARKKRQPKKLTLADLGILGKVLVLHGPSLGQQFKKIGVVGFEVPGQQNVWVDVAGIVRSVERAAGAQGGVAGQGARLFAERAADLRDALYEMRPGKEGLDADLWLRFLPPKKSAAK